MLYSFKRLINDPLKLLVMLFLLILPFFENILFLYEYFLHRSVPNPNFSLFLAGASVGNGHILQGILLWFAPLYFLILFSEDCLQDFKTKNINIVVSKLGLKKYVLNNLIKSFLGAFLLIIISLTINLLTTYIIFNGGTASKIDTTILGDQGVNFYTYSVTHPLLTNIIYIIITSIIMGFISMTGTSVAILLKNRVQVYSIVMFLWYVFCSIPNSIIYATQPFTEYGLDTTYESLIFYILLNSVVVFSLTLKETKYAKNQIL